MMNVGERKKEYYLLKKLFDTGNISAALQHHNNPQGIVFFKVC
jgi:hypothetical protein